MSDDWESYKRLRKHWMKELAKNGFKDIEDLKGNLKQPDLRYQKYKFKNQIEEFIDGLADWLRTNPDITNLQRAILEHHVEGLAQVKIAQILGCTKDYVNITIRKYKRRTFILIS